MPRTSRTLLPLLISTLAMACRSDSSASLGTDGPDPKLSVEALEPGRRPVLLEQVDDVAIVQLYADGFERLSLQEKQLAWHLYQAALAGRDVYYQQKCADGLVIRDLLEEIVTHPEGVEPRTLENVKRYLKLFWVNSSPYDSMTSRKFVMGGTIEDLVAAARAAARSGAELPKRPNETIRNLITRLGSILFDPQHEPMLTAKNPPEGLDVVQASAVTFYGEGVTVADLEGFEDRYPLNSTVRRNAAGALEEAVWRAGDAWRGVPAGLYAPELARVIEHLIEAAKVAPEPTRAALEALVRFYRTGERADREAYDIAWVADADSSVDTINGFVEVYHDPRGRKGSWEGIVFYEDPEKAALIRTIADHAQWFEDHMPYDERFRKPEVKGISARSIDVVIETGDAGPVTAIGINLPNDARIREEHGSKSVSLANVKTAYDESTPTSSRREFCWDEAEVAREERWGSLTADLLTNMHEVIGHASGRQAQDDAGEPIDATARISEYYSALEEARADLVALWFMMDPELVELGLIDDVDEAALATYERYTRNGGMLQLRRVKEGQQLEQDHMRNRQLVVRWIMANSTAVEERERDGKHYLVVTDARAWRAAAGQLLTLVQRIKSTGDHDAAKALVDGHGVHFDAALRDEVVERYEALGLPAYTGFVMPRLTPVVEGGELVDVAISYPLSIEQQMLEWSGRRPVPAPAQSAPTAAGGAEPARDAGARRTGEPGNANAPLGG
jgi:dipeptidyl-peptidase-3